MTLVFVHGAGCTRDVFAHQVDAFAGSVALALPGNGVRVQSIEDFAAAVADALRDADIAEAVLCGSSMGGAIALELALQRNPRVRALVLLGSGARLRVAPATLEALQADFPSASHAFAQHCFAQATPELVGTAVRMLEHRGQQQTLADLRACDAFDRIARLGEMHLPGLALNGRLDALTPPKYALLLGDRIPGAKVEIIEHAGHLAMLERPRETNAALYAFLDSLA